VRLEEVVIMIRNKKRRYK